MLETNKNFFMNNMKIPLFFTIVLIVVSYYNYLLYHILVEFTSIAVALILFAIVLIFQSQFRSSLLPYIAIGYFYISIIDLLHTLAYKGMNILTAAGDSANLATQLWIEARFLQALVLVTAIYFIDKKVSNKILVVGLGAIVTTITLLVFKGYAPDAFIDGYGLTLFKISMEYVIVVILLFTLYKFYTYREILGEKTTFVLIVSIIFTIFSELAFTFYISVFGLSNLIGHLFKFFAFWFIFVLVQDFIKEQMEK